MPAPRRVTRDESTRALVEPVNVALEVAGDERIVRGHDLGQSPMGQSALTPQLSACTPAHRNDVAVRSGHVQRIIVDAQPVIAGCIVRPPHLSIVERKHRDAPLEPNGIHVRPDNIDRGINVGIGVNQISASSPTWWLACPVNIGPPRGCDMSPTRIPGQPASFFALAASRFISATMSGWAQ